MFSTVLPGVQRHSNWLSAPEVMKHHKKYADTLNLQSLHETLNPDINCWRFCSFQSYFTLQTSYQTRAMQQDLYVF